MSIRLKKVEWIQIISGIHAKIGGYEYRIIPTKGDFCSSAKYTAWVMWHKSLDAAKSACESHALERIKQVVEVDSGWQPISTAPRDGRILVWISAVTKGTLDDGSYYETDSSVCDVAIWSSLLGRYENDMGPVGDDEQITHWQPLPQPPKGGER